MTDAFITPEGKFDVVLVGMSHWDGSLKKVNKFFITNEDENCSSAKSPYGMFKDIHIPNDLGYVNDAIRGFYGI